MTSTGSVEFLRLVRLFGTHHVTRRSSLLAHPGVPPGVTPVLETHPAGTTHVIDPTAFPLSRSTELIVRRLIPTPIATSLAFILLDFIWGGHIIG